MRLLLAEDDAILADALSANLRSAGFEVEVAENGAVPSTSWSNTISTWV